MTFTFQRYWVGDIPIFFACIPRRSTHDDSAVSPINFLLPGAFGAPKQQTPKHPGRNSYIYIYIHSLNLSGRAFGTFRVSLNSETSQFTLRPSLLLHAVQPRLWMRDGNDRMLMKDPSLNGHPSEGFGMLRQLWRWRDRA